MRHILLFFFLLMIGLTAHGQNRLIGERSVYTQYFESPYLLNPGATGLNDYSEVLANYRSAWASFPGSPKTITVAYDGPVGNRLGLGLIGVSDTYAGFSTNKGILNLSYSIKTPDHQIGFGLTGEFIQHTLTSDAVANTIINDTDPAILSRLDGSTYFDGGFGLYGEYKGKVIYGVSLPALISNRINGVGDDNAETEISYIAHLGYRLQVEDKDITFEPSVWVKKLMMIPMHVDINLKADFLNEQLTAGLVGSVGAEERVGFLIGTQVDNFGLHYTYNVSLNEFQEFNNGSHEIGLKLRLQPYNRTPPPSDN
ncbi:MAG: PorP/SprF family type IX secretion system membrane protein [Bacteroidota bacterium]